MKTVIQALQYFYYSAKYPNRKDFIKMGLGIQARYDRNKNNWEPHLRCSKSAISEVVNSLYYSTGKKLKIIVLGTGRLLDFPIDALNLCKESVFVDADPLGLSIAKCKVNSFLKSNKITCVVKFVCADITGLIDKDLSKLTESDFINNPLKLIDSDKFDLVISLNILGQIPIYFSDRYSGIESQLSNNLQCAHIENSLEICKLKALFLYDKEFYTYTPDVSQWEVEEATCDEIWKKYKKKSIFQSAWLWHICRYDKESYGAIHRIEAVLVTLS